MFKALFGSKNTVLDPMQSSFCIYYMLLLAILVLFVLPLSFPQMPLLVISLTYPVSLMDR